MPFCSQCGNDVGTAPYCRRCGARQPEDGQAAPPPPPPPLWPGYRDPLAQIPPRTLSILCYIPVIGWIASIVVLASDHYRKNREVRFHAFQSLYLFVAWLLDDQALGPLMSRAHVPIHELIKAVLFGMSIFMMVKASQGEAFSLPLFGDLARKSVAED